MTHHSKMTFDAWCNHIQMCADNMTGGLFKWRNIAFNYADRYLDGEPLATTIDSLVVAAFAAAKMAAKARGLQ